MGSRGDSSSEDRPTGTILIIGAGVFGTSTAYHLAQTHADPSKIAVLDRTPYPPTPAASTDINKIIRFDYGSKFYSDLAREALDAWANWEELKPFYHRSGWVFLRESHSDLPERIREVFRSQGRDPTEDVALEDVGERWGGVLKGTSFEGLKDAYANPEAGWCEAGAATASLMAAAERRGVQYLKGDVQGLEMDAGRVKGVKLVDGRLIEAEKIVVAAGAWTSSLLSPVEDQLDIAEADRAEKQVQAAGVNVAHFEMSDDEMEQLKDMPVVVYGEHGEVIPPPKGNRLLKFTHVNGFTNKVKTSTGHVISVPPARDQEIVPERLKREMEEAMMTKVMPTFTCGKEVAYWRLCWDARTPTQDWLLCKHPHSQLGNVYFATGGSFHSYKFLPNVGKYMVNVLSGKGNGPESNKAWGWKRAGDDWRGAHEKTRPKCDLDEIERATQ